MASRPKHSYTRIMLLLKFRRPTVLFLSSFSRALFSFHDYILGEKLRYEQFCCNIYLCLATYIFGTSFVRLSGHIPAKHERKIHTSTNSSSGFYRKYSSAGPAIWEE